MESVVATLPAFEVQIAAPDLSRWLPGNTGLSGFWRFSAERPGPHVLVTALVHGNEIAGAAVLDRVLCAAVRPTRGTLTLGFANLEAFARFDPEHPTASRFVDEDMNRVWDAAVLDGSRYSVELDRARLMRPLVEQADMLLDLHSMLWPSDPLILCGPTRKGRELAARIGVPETLVADFGHVGGRRLIDFAPFVDPADTRTAVLVEAGQHWQSQTVTAMMATLRRLLAVTGIVPAAACDPAPAPRFAEVTDAVTAATGNFAFVRPFRGGEVIARQGTLIAVDGGTEIRTPYDDCLLVMPSLRASRGHTAVRLARTAPRNT